jgi:hypothetical protein
MTPFGSVNLRRDRTTTKNKQRDGWRSEKKLDHRTPFLASELRRDTLQIISLGCSLHRIDSETAVCLMGVQLRAKLTKILLQILEEKSIFDLFYLIFPAQNSQSLPCHPSSHFRVAFSPLHVFNSKIIVKTRNIREIIFYIIIFLQVLLKGR